MAARSARPAARLPRLLLAAALLLAGGGSAALAQREQPLDPSPLPPADPGGSPEKEPAPQPEGPVLGEEQMRSSVMENRLPQRVPVLPDEPDSAVWEVNPRVAFNQAQRLQRPLLLLFTADWSPRGISLSGEVFATRTFNDFVKDHAVICFLNYPRNRTDAPPSMRRWKEQFKVNGYPSLLVFDPEGNVVQEISGYSPGKPVTYFNRLKGVVQPLSDGIEQRKAELRRRGFRDWRNHEGEILFARFVRRAGDLATLQGVNQETWTINIATLSGEDQALAMSFPDAGEIASP